MTDYWVCFDFNIINGKEIVKSDGFCIDARHYLSQHLECDWEDVEKFVAKASDKTFKSIAKWAASGCDYMASVSYEGISDVITAIATEMSEKLSDGDTEKYDEIYEDIYDNLSYKITSVELRIDGKTFTGK